VTSEVLDCARTTEAGATKVSWEAVAGAVTPTSADASNQNDSCLIVDPNELTGFECRLGWRLLVREVLCLFHAGVEGWDRGTK